ncbi:MAG: hypothetical protein MRJ93_14830 [Nitrososphaeraceae archaeon]|nr:hypothetical protein [Nitrososphaeraceae archaeon]
MHNSKIGTGTMFLLAAILVAGTISMTVPASFAQPYSGEQDYKDPSGKDYKSYGNQHEKKFPFGKEFNKDPKGVSIQKIKCVNSNININGIEVKKTPRVFENDAATTDAFQDDGLAENNRNGLFGDSGLNVDRNLVNICVNFNYNEQEEAYGLDSETIGEEETETIGEEETETIGEEETETVGEEETETIGEENISQQVEQTLPMNTSSSTEQVNSQVEQTLPMNTSSSTEQVNSQVEQTLPMNTSSSTEQVNSQLNQLNKLQELQTQKLSESLK